MPTHGLDIGAPGEIATVRGVTEPFVALRPMLGKKHEERA